MRCYGNKDDRTRAVETPGHALIAAKVTPARSARSTGRSRTGGGSKDAVGQAVMSMRRPMGAAVPDRADGDRPARGVSNRSWARAGGSRRPWPMDAPATAATAAPAPRNLFPPGTPSRLKPGAIHRSAYVGASVLMVFPFTDPTVAARTIGHGAGRADRERSGKSRRTHRSVMWGSESSVTERKALRPTRPAPVHPHPRPDTSACSLSRSRRSPWPAYPSSARGDRGTAHPRRGVAIFAEIRKFLRKSAVA